MKVLLAATEVSPLTKESEVADFTGFISRTLNKISINVDVVVPFFPFTKVPLDVYKSFDLFVSFGGEKHEVGVYKTTIQGSNTHVFMLKNDSFFGSVNHIDLTQDLASDSSLIRAFTFFNRAVVSLISTGFNTYDIIHCNNWETSLVPHILQDEFGSDRPKTLFTVHDINHQAIGGAEMAKDLGLVPGLHPLVDWDTSDGDINFMLQGIGSADYISTVSPTYSKELLLDSYSGILSDVLKNRGSRLIGILNGIADEKFPRYNDVSQWKSHKAVAKQNLQNKLGLNPVTDKPLYSFVSRLSPSQKGIDILAENIPDIILHNGQFVLLGTGDKTWERKFSELQSTARADISVNIVQDEELAAQIYRASDFVLAPSRYEPCGVSQLAAMRYGALPIARSTGGLRDIVRDGVNGMTFDDFSAQALSQVISKSFSIYHSSQYDNMVNVALNTDIGWDKCANEYVKLYEKILEL